MTNYDKALKTLEYNKILSLLASCALTEGAREKALALKPTNDIYRIRKMQLQTSDAKRLDVIKGMPPFGNVKDITPSLERAQKGAVLTTRELLDIAAVLTSARRLLEYINTDKSLDTVLDENFELLTPNKAFENKINRSIIAEDLIADDASPELSDIRRKIKNANNKIKDSLQKITSGSSYSKYLQENIVTMRNSRYVIPVKTEYKNEIKGLVHDTSASGATMFIEPLSVVEANNELRELYSRETHEIEKILASLSAECADNVSILSYNYENITELALIFARAQLSMNLDASQPDINEKGEFTLYHARHPLLDKKTVVPINVSVGDKYDTLVITGPNTGGKTVTLKTLGLLALMVQSGLHIPADDNSTVCIFDNILADIGDEQSIEQSLSTFSAHMVNIVDITAKANEKSLVLFDELGAGTDPVEGAALAVSILEAIRAKGALCAATTHYAELKAYALETDGVCNASCEFDIETLKPTYRLITGTPGKSNAFAISRKLGLDEEIINRAKDFVSSDKKHFEYVIEKLEQTRIEMEHERETAARLRREFEAFKSEAERKLKEKVERTEKELAKRQEQAAGIIQSAKASSDYILSELDKIKKQRDSEHFSENLEKARANIRRKLQQADNEANPVYEKKVTDYVLPRKLKKGDAVIIVNIGKQGVVTEEPDKDGNVLVRAGIINTKTKIKNLMLVEDDKVNITLSDNKKVSRAGYSKKVSADFRPELDLRGMNSEDAWYLTDKYLDDANIAGIHTVTLIHGKGTGVLKTSIRSFLKKDKRVKDFREGIYGEGDGGVTIVELK